MYMYNEYAGDELAGEGGDLKLACVLRRTKKERKGNKKKIRSVVFGSVGLSSSF